MLAGMLRDLELHLSSPFAIPRSVVVPPGGLTVGRDPGCDVVIVTRKISRRHARFIRLDDAVFVEDLGSHNGIFIDGKRVQGRVRLERGALVVLGDVVAMLTSGLPPEAREGDAVELSCAVDDAEARVVTVQLPVRLRFVTATGSSGVRLWRGPGGRPLVQQDGGAPAARNGAPIMEQVVRLTNDDVLGVGPFHVRVRAVAEGRRTALSLVGPGGDLVVMPAEPDLLER